MRAGRSYSLQGMGIRSQRALAENMEHRRSTRGTDYPLRTYSQVGLYTHEDSLKHAFIIRKGEFVPLLSEWHLWFALFASFVHAWRIHKLPTSVHALTFTVTTAAPIDLPQQLP
jgi:hypothetical protein